MLPIECRGEEVTPELLETIKTNNSSEATFAVACLQAGCQLRWQIPIEGGSIIDFWVVNPRRSDAGKLVEITRQKRNRVENPARPDIKRKSILRKRRQIENMKASGEKWTILYRREMESIGYSHSIVAGGLEETS